MPPGLTAHPGDVLLMVGTRKGSFLISSDSSRQSWQVEGPYSAGGDVFHLTYDPRDGGRVLAATNYRMWGPQIEFSDDLGQTWEQAEGPPRFSGEAGENGAAGPTVSRLWHIETGLSSEPGVVFAGAEPASLFKSQDGGNNWQELAGISQHPTRAQWQPGLGGLCLHSMVLDPQNPDRMWVGMSAVGVFGTEDGGKSWHPRNSGVRADFAPDPLPEFGQCPHKVLAHPSRLNRLYQQNHCGVYRSDSGGQDWQDITEGLPSRFGFVLGIHSQDPDTIYVLPEDQVQGTDVGGGLRYVTEAKFRVYRSRDGGENWEALTNGLPQQGAYLHVLREGMATDHLDLCGIYLGTTTGQLFYSRNDGDSWELLLEHLPPINSVDCAAVV